MRIQSAALVVAAMLATTLPSGVEAAGPSVLARVNIRDAAGSPARGAKVGFALLTGPAPVGQGAPIGSFVNSTADGIASSTIALTGADRAAIASNGGWANFQATTFGEDGRPTAFTSFPEYIGSDATGQAEARIAATPTIVLGSARPVVRLGAGQPKAAPAYTGCNNYRWTLYATSTVSTIIGQLHSSADTNQAKFTFGRTADSSIDVGYGTNGANWTISGTVHVGNSLGTAVGVTPGSYYYRYLLTQMQYGHYRLLADCLEGYNLYLGYDISEALAWEGGIQQSSYTISYYDNQAHGNYDWNDFGPTAFFSRNQNSLMRISFAVTAFGASLGTQSGSSTYVTYYYKFGTAAHHYLYGLTAYPPTAGAIYASDY